MSIEEFILHINEEGIHLCMSRYVAMLERGDISPLDVYHIVVKNQEPESFYACWILNHYIDSHNMLLESSLDEAVVILPNIHRSGLLRLVLRLFTVTPTWHIEHLGLLLDFCLATIQDMTMPVGVTTQAMSIVDKIAETEPDIHDEFLLVIKGIYPYLSTGGKNKAEKIIKKYTVH